jgi:alkylation response protein AidB-like acyl-CoA dehydrogenase
VGVYFGLNDDQRALQSVVRSFLEDTSPLESVVVRVSAGGGYDETVWRRMATELDLIGIAVPERYGGTGSTAFDLYVVLAELGRAMYAGPYFSSAVLATTALLACDDEDARADHLPRLLSGEVLATFAGAESGLLEIASLPLSAHRDGARWRVNGQVTHVVDGMGADVVYVVARTTDGAGCFAISASDDGISRVPRPALDLTRPLASITFNEAAGACVGSAGAGGAVLQRVMQVASVGLAAEQVGGAERCLELAVEHAKRREQFGRPIGSFQAVKHRCADVLVVVEAAKSAAMYAAWALSCDEVDQTAAASVAKACCSDAFSEAAKSAIQVHGGLGFTWEHPAHLFLRRAISSRELFGSPALHRERVLTRLIG